MGVHDIRKADCTPAEWKRISAIRREQQYTSERHLGEKANAWLRKPWGKLRKHPAVDSAFIFKGK
jgi:hypothetical protein